MKNLDEFILEGLGCKNCDKTEEEEVEASIKSEKDFREYAKNKFKEVFGDKLDKKRMEFTIQGILDDNKKAIEDGDWGMVVGKLNKSFGK